MTEPKQASSSKFLELLMEATEIWGQLISGSFKHNEETGSTSIYDFEDYKSVDQMNQMVETDQTGLSTAFVLWGLHHRRLRSLAFTFEELINQEQKNSEEYSLSKQLHRQLRHPTIFEELQEHSNVVRSSLSHYKASEESLQLVNDFEVLGNIREAAMLSLSNLEVHQFLQGEPTGDAGKINPDVYRFLDVSSAINAIQICGQIGMTFAVISDNEADKQEDLNAFFALFIYDGGTLSMITDKTEWVHPRQSSMMRNSRHVARKHSESYFPYELLEIVFSDNGRSAQVPTRSGLINFEFKMSKVKAISELEPESVIFLSMLIDLSKTRFIDKKEKVAELSYVMNSVHVAALNGPAGPTTLINLDQSEKLPELRTEDVNHEAVEWECDRNHGFYQWAEDRFLSDMPNEFLGLYEDVDSQQVLIPDGNEIEVPGELDFHDRALGVKETSLTTYKRSVVSVKKDTFGTLESLDRNQKWMARYNQALWVSQRIKEEVKKQEDELKQYMRDCLTLNMENIEKAIAAGSIQGRKVVRGIGSSGIGLTDWYKNQEIETNFLSLHYNRKGNNGTYRWYRCNTIIEGDWYRSKPLCYINGKSATVFAIFRPDSPDQLSTLLGVEVDKLPYLLQNYWVEEPYTGNSILNCIDPMDWVNAIQD